MSWVDDAVASFGRNLGLARLDLPPSGAVTLAFAQRGTLALERAPEDDLLLYLQRERPHAPTPLLAKALAMCHWQMGHAFPVRAGMKDERLVLLIRLPGREVTPEALARGFERLVQLMDELDR
jgi:type III secretion system chaperone SycN